MRQLLIGCMPRKAPPPHRPGGSIGPRALQRGRAPKLPAREARGTEPKSIAPHRDRTGFGLPLRTGGHAGWVVGIFMPSIVHP